MGDTMLAVSEISTNTAAGGGLGYAHFTEGRAGSMAGMWGTIFMLLRTCGGTLP